MKRFLLATSAVFAAGVSYGEAQRTTLTLENKFPELHQVEAGGTVMAREFSDTGDHLTTVAPYIRYGLFKDLTVYGEIPYAQSDREWLDDGQGLGDIKAGLQLKAYEDIFSYPWVVPHVDISFSTGDEDKGLGYGETVYTMGISVGTKMYEEFSLIADVSYAINGGFDSGLVPGSTTDAHETADAVIIAGSFVWDVSERFAVLAEGKLVQDNSTSEEKQPAYAGAGLAYKFTENFLLGANVGGWNNADGQTDVIVKGAYTF